MQERLSSAKEAPATPTRRIYASVFGNEAAFVTSGSRVLQCKCACGRTPDLDGECAECRKKRLQRRATDRAAPATAPSLVDETLRSPGQPLDHDTRAFMEPRFGHDFGRVRVHEDSRAAESARAVNALAYTVGGDIVFGAGQYAPHTFPGKRLLAHELTHVIQQSASGEQPAHPLEREAADSAERVVRGGHARPSRQVAAPGIAMQPKEPGVITLKPIEIIGDPEFYERARRSNRFYASYPPRPGWPYDERLRALWLGKAYDDFADAVRDYQLEVMGPEEADGILGPKTAASLESKPMTSSPSLEAKMTSEVATPPATAPDDRTGSQRLRLDELRKLHKTLATEFKVMDGMLPGTKVYDAYVTVRQNVMEDVERVLNEAEGSLSGPNAASQAETIRGRLEQAQLWLFFVAPYAQLAALMRSAEIDRLDPNVIVSLSSEATRYERAFTLVSKGTAKDLKYARDNALALTDRTKKLIGILKDQIERGKKAVATLKTVTAVIDVPLAFAQGRILPVWAMLGVLVSDWSGFLAAHGQNLVALQEHGPSFIYELGWLEYNAPLVREHILHPIFKAMGTSSVRGVSMADVAFILGRALRGIAQSGGKLSWKLVTTALIKATAIVSLIRSPKFVALGLAPLSQEKAKSIEEAIGGANDPKGVISDLNEVLGSQLTYAEAVALLNEMRSAPVLDHLVLLAESGELISPHIGAIIADLTATGMATAATAATAPALTVPLLPPAP